MHCFIATAICFIWPKGNRIKSCIAFEAWNYISFILFVAPEKLNTLESYSNQFRKCKQNIFVNE